MSRWTKISHNSSVGRLLSLSRDILDFGTVWLMLGRTHCWKELFCSLGIGESPTKNPGRGARNVYSMNSCTWFPPETEKPLPKPWISSPEAIFVVLYEEYEVNDGGCLGA